jgi:hypothetical protein
VTATRTPALPGLILVLPDPRRVHLQPKPQMVRTQMVTAPGPNVKRGTDFSPKFVIGL